MRAWAAVLLHSQQAQNYRPHYMNLLHHTVLAWASSLLLHRPLCLSLSLTTLPTTILCICVHAHAVRSQRWGVGGQRDFTVLLRTIPLLMHLSALCFVNEDQ